MEERRQKIRISASLSVSYQVVKSFRMVTSRARNVSESGLCMPILQNLHPGMKLDMEISLDISAKPIKAVGEVVWTKKINDLRFPFVTGVKFVKINPESLNQLRNYIKENSPIEHVQLVEDSSKIEEGRP